MNLFGRNPAVPTTATDRRTTQLIKELFSYNTGYESNHTRKYSTSDVYKRQGVGHDTVGTEIVTATHDRHESGDMIAADT